jgi:protein disulfide-isomerase
MKKLLPYATGALALLALATSAMAKPGWSEDFEKASAQAKTDKKLLLMDFTGSDWCGWCIKFDKEVLATSEFEEYAKKNLVLFEADFPNKVKQSDELKTQNKKLQDQYGVKGFPTFVVLDGEGKKVGEFVGYQAGGPAAFIAALEKLKNK